jgi:hypothetical protein
MGTVVALGDADEADLRHPSEAKFIVGAQAPASARRTCSRRSSSTSRPRSQSAGRCLLARTSRRSETATRIAGKSAKQRYHVPDAGWTRNSSANTWDDTAEAPARCSSIDSFGQNDWDIIEDRIRFIANAEGVKDFFIDHLTALAAWKDDERKALEEIMSRIGGTREGTRHHHLSSSRTWQRRKASHMRKAGE